MTAGGLRRLHWGCGNGGTPGWINSDRQAGPRIDFCCDVREGLPLESDSIDYAVSVHALQEVPWNDLGTVLGELRRVLKPDGVLRLCLPDLDKGVQAYVRRDAAHFLVPDDVAQSLGGKFVLHMLWLGHSRLLFTHDFAEEVLRRAGFRHVVGCEYRQTRSHHPGITDLDDRPHESLFVEATK